MSYDNSTTGYHLWRHLLFMHWRMDPEDLQSQLHDDLTIQEFDGAAWLGFVPFSMERIRPCWSVPLPGVSWFLETNVRTYVQHENGLRAVWFFSLDANSRIAVRIARWFWNLNYIDCRMELHRECDKLRYRGQRLSSPNRAYDVRCRIPSATPKRAANGSLEEFLLERYTLLSRSRGGEYWSGQVHHTPYKFVPVNDLQCEETLTCGLRNTAAAPDHAVYSPGVDVRVSRLQRVSTWQP